MSNVEAKGTTPDGHEYVVHAPHDPDAPRYPRIGTHEWGCWPVIAVEREGEPVVAVETGGYHDLEAVDPYTGRALWTRAFAGKDTSVYDALRRLVDAMEAAKFLDEGTPQT